MLVLPALRTWLLLVLAVGISLDAAHPPLHSDAMDGETPVSNGRWPRPAFCATPSADCRLRGGASQPAGCCTCAGGQFWQITDLHWDRNYSAAGDPSDWCHDTSNTSDTNGTNGAYGSYACDAPWQLVKESVRHMASVQPRPSFIVWTGDSSPHWSDGPNFKYVFSVMDAITRLLRKLFPDTPIIPCIGNHDSFPPDQFPDDDKAFYTRYLSEGGWNRLLSQDEQRTFITAGYFSRRLTDALTVLSLNTNIYYRPNSAISPKEPDPGQQLGWLRHQLKNARTEGYKVVIAAHIAPGYFERNTDLPFMFSFYNEALIGLLSAYHDVIMAQVYGHAHTDSFRVLGEMIDDELQIQSALFLAPSVTPWVPGAGTNPGVRLYTYSAGALADYSQHVLNLTASNAAGAAQWRHLYSASDTYGLADLSAASMADLYGRLVANATLFQTYYLLNTGGHVAGACHLACRRSQLCAIGHLTERAMAACLNSVTADAVLAGEMLAHGPAVGGAAPAAAAAAASTHYAAIVVAVVASLVVLSALVVFVALRMRKRPTVLRNVASFVSVGSQGYETMT